MQVTVFTWTLNTLLHKNTVKHAILISMFIIELTIYIKTMYVTFTLQFDYQYCLHFTKRFLDEATHKVIAIWSCCLHTNTTVKIAIVVWLVITEELYCYKTTIWHYFTFSIIRERCYNKSDWSSLTPATLYHQWVVPNLVLI